MTRLAHSLLIAPWLLVWAGPAGAPIDPYQPGTCGPVLRFHERFGSEPVHRRAVRGEALEVYWSDRWVPLLATLRGIDAVCIPAPPPARPRGAL